MSMVTVSPDQQIQNISYVLEQTESDLERSGIDVRLLRQWLHQTLHYRAMLEQHGRGELQPIEYDEADGDY